MGQAFTWCFAAPVFAFLAFFAIMFIGVAIAKLLPDGPPLAAPERADERAMDCARCSKTIRFVVPAPPRIRCSCGNVMGKPDGAKATCPKCRQTIHVSRQNGPLLVKCPCGNVAEVAP